jgi:glyoxylase-like metal-dependent hydrolase (beta-lactamase superfamily II)
MEIIEGIHRIDEASDNPAHANVYLVVNGGDLTVIDTGTPGNAQKIIDYVWRLGYRPADVKNIVITHYHRDHTGSMKELKDITKARVAASRQEAGFVSGREPLPPPKDPSFRTDLAFDPVDVDVVLDEGDKIADLTVFLTPGHTPGSIMLLDERRKVLFAGDTLGCDGMRVSEAPDVYSMDMEQMRRSIAKVSALRFETVLPGHGQPLRAGGTGAVKRICVMGD